MIQISNLEKRLLLISVYAAIGFSVLGIVIGLLVNSQFIFFDGIYSLISVALSGLSLLAAKYIGKNDWKRFPFGKDVIEPIVIIIKYTIIFLLVVASLIVAMISLFQGGRDVAIGVALIYSLVGTVGCFLTYLYFKKHTGKTQSGFLTAESNQWLIDTFVSAGVLIAFIVASILQNISSLAYIVPYVDPVMVIIISLYFMKLPIKGIKASLREVLSMAPKKELRQEVEQVMVNIEKEYNLAESFIRVSKTSKTLWIEVDFVVDNNSKIKTITDQDKVREEIKQNLSKINYEKWLTISFTSDRKWAL
ncbi:cation diffusion facilitator family transporter [Desulfitispora alkaliphila]|uniref:cation diffusion facilitator family transporter n=1 Tax=Desulfitispora alkaliphila TaxID=622674 RepID=UPI003D1F511B